MEPARRIDLSATLEALRADQADPYAGADPDNAARLVGLLWLLVGLLTLAFLPLDPPTAQGASGWAIAAAIAGFSLAGAVCLLRSGAPPSFATLLALSYAGLLQVAVLVWLGGGAGSAYQSLFLLWLGAGMGVHPPRRALAFLAVTVLVAAAPLAYQGWSGSAAADITSNLLLWAALGTAMLTLMVAVRAQRLRMRAAESHERELARVDVLTGLANRRAFDEALATEVARSERAGSTLSVLLVDLDGFKAINDELGHLEGDRCLVAVAAAITRSIRASDRAFRWGGDELAVLLSDTDYAGAETVAAVVSAEVLSSCSDARGRPLSVSIGAVEGDPEYGVEELVGRADLQLMTRKRRRVPLARDDETRRDYA